MRLLGSFLLVLALPGAGDGSAGRIPAHAEAVPAGSAGALAPDEEISALISRLRDPKLAPEQRVELEERLLALGEHGARALQRVVEERARKLDERARKEQRAWLASLARAAERLVAARLDRAATAEVEALRKQAADLRRDPALTKERIVAEGDPARERLAELLLVSVADVLEQDRARAGAGAAPDPLGAAREALDADLLALEQEFHLWQRCNAALPEEKRSQALADPAERRGALVDAEEWACALATPMSKSDREVLEENRARSASLADPEEAAGVLDLNRLRLLLGLPALALDLKLCDAARGHSADMRALGFFAHESPVEGKRTPGERAARAGTSASAENIAAGQRTGAGANRGWWHSPGHHKNMLGYFGRVGAGRCEDLWTQMFG